MFDWKRNINRALGSEQAITQYICVRIKQRYLRNNPPPGFPDIPRAINSGPKMDKVMMEKKASETSSDIEELDDDDEYYDEDDDDDVDDVDDLEDYDDKKKKKKKRKKKRK